MRLAFGLARTSMMRGDDPIGAVLVRDGLVVAQSADSSVTASDPTAHAELNLIREYCRAHNVFSLEGYSLYTTTEPCIMCSGAIHWAKVSKVYFSVPQGELQKRTGGNPKPSCETLINCGHKKIAIVGNVLLDEGLRVLDQHVFRSKVERHAEIIRKSRT